MGLSNVAGFEFVELVCSMENLIKLALRFAFQTFSISLREADHSTHDRGLCDELQSLRKNQVQGYEVALRSDSEIGPSRDESFSQPELKSFNPDTAKMVTKIAVFDEAGSPKIHLPPGEDSELPMDERCGTEGPSDSGFVKTNSRRISAYSSDSRVSQESRNCNKPRRTMTASALEIASDPVHSYSINGIKKKDGKVGSSKFNRNAS